MRAIVLLLAFVALVAARSAEVALPSSLTDTEAASDVVVEDRDLSEAIQVCKDECDVEKQKCQFACDRRKNREKKKACKARCKNASFRCKVRTLTRLSFASSLQLFFVVDVDVQHISGRLSPVSTVQVLLQGV